jgi:preprotein translocase subunit SecA
MTDAFGRGTDFELLDDHIKSVGGLHVIQAFLSLEESEEVQIKGRTARQNNNGSYDCIITENCLQKLGIMSI